jgi:hypothetical protein
MKIKATISIALVMASTLLVFAGCSTLDKAFTKEVTMSTQPVVQVVTNVVVVTNFVPQIIEKQVAGAVVHETNYMTLVQTNLFPYFVTNTVQVPVTNLVAKPEVDAGIQSIGSAVNTFLPGVGSILALLFGGFYHGYAQVRNKKVQAALVQGVETARAILETTPQGEDLDAEFVAWLKAHQKASGVLSTVADVVSKVDNNAAQMSAQFIKARVTK